MYHKVVAESICKPIAYSINVFLNTVEHKLTENHLFKNPLKQLHYIKTYVILNLP